MKNVLITTDEVIFHAPTKATLDPRNIQQNIIIAEERFIRPALGYSFYEAIIAEKNVVVTSGNQSALQTATGVSSLVLGTVINALEFLSANNLALWKNYLWKLTAECVMLMSTPEAYIHFGSEGVVMSAPPAGPLTGAAVVAPDLKSVKWLMDKKMMDRIDPLTEAMHNYLCRYKPTYVQYGKDCDCDTHGVSYKRKTDLILGIYDDEDRRYPREPQIQREYVIQNPATVGMTRVLLTIAVEGQTAFNLPTSPANNNLTLLFLNGQKMTYAIDYTITGSVLTWINTMILDPMEDQLEFYY